jgi:FtsP/CotA-like multicopper oxidase with cupredoxin domain
VALRWRRRGALLAVSMLGTGMASADGPDRVLELTIAAGVVSGAELAPARGAPVLRVRQGEPVRLRWTSDVDIELHLHGYEVVITVPSGGAAVMEVDARAAGRFQVATHGASTFGPDHTVLLYLEVHPP